MKIDIKDKIAIITGACCGIGKACAKLMMENSARVIIANINKVEGKKAVAELSALGKCEFIHTDVSNKKSVQNLIERAVKKFKRIDIFVNSAGINVVKNRVDISKYSSEDWKRVLEVDLNGTFLCCQAVSRVMIKQKEGKVINIGSVLGNIPARKQIAYIAAKAAVHNLTKAMALELAPYGINVNAVAPGSILTQLTEKLFYGKGASHGKKVKQMLSHIPFGRPGKPEDVANAVLFLSGEESKYITGHILIVDGGWTCGYARDF